MPPSANPRSCSRVCGRRNYEPVAAFGKIRAGAASRAGGRERLPAPLEVPWPQSVAGRVAAVLGGALSRPVYAAEVLLGGCRRWISSNVESTTYRHSVDGKSS